MWQPEVSKHILDLFLTSYTHSNYLKGYSSVLIHDLKSIAVCSKLNLLITISTTIIMHYVWLTLKWSRNLYLEKKISNNRLLVSL